MSARDGLTGSAVPRAMNMHECTILPIPLATAPLVRAQMLMRAFGPFLASALDDYTHKDA